MSDSIVTYMAFRDASGTVNHIHRFSYTLDYVAIIDPNWAYPNVRNGLTMLELDDVKVYHGLGMVHVDGKLLKMDFTRVSENMRLAEFESRLSRAVSWAMRKVSHVRALDGPSQRPVSRQRVGAYVLFFASNLQNRLPVFSNNVMVDRWGPRLRTYDAWLVLLQRRVKFWAGAKKRLAFAMALHPRLGHFSGASCLGQDLAGKICAHI